MKSYLEKNDLHYFTFPANSEKPMKRVIHLLPPGTPVEDISNSLENLGFNVINVRQMTATQIAPKWTNTHVTPPSIPCYLKKKHKISRGIHAE
jgi:hypothetical protein